MTMEGIEPTRECRCGSGEVAYWVNDGYGIPLCKVCTACEARELSKYRSDIMSRYECDEPIEPEEW